MAEDLSQALQEISAAIGNAMSTGIRQIADEIGEFKESASASNAQVEKIVGDLYRAIQNQTTATQGIENTLESSKQSEQSNNAETVSVAYQQLSELRNVTAALRNMDGALTKFNKTLKDFSQSQEYQQQAIAQSITQSTADKAQFTRQQLLQQSSLLRFLEAFKGSGIGTGIGQVIGAALPGAIAAGASTETGKSIINAGKSFLGLPQSNAPSGDIRTQNGVFNEGPAKPLKPGQAFKQKAPMLIDKLSSDLGLTKEQSAGIVGSLGAETRGFELFQEQKPLIAGSRGGFGWAQWTGPRRRQFEAYAAAHGLDPRSDEANYGFLKQELQTTYKGELNRVKQTKTAEEASHAFTGSTRERFGFLRPGIEHYGSSARYAATALALSNSSKQNVVAQDTPTGAKSKETEESAPVKPEAKEYAGLEGGKPHGMLSSLPSAKHDGSGGGEARREDKKEQTGSEKVDKSAVTGKSLDGLDSNLMNKFLAAATEYKEKTGQTVNVTSALRTQEKQAQLYAAYKAGRGLPANPPGVSNHEVGKAVDVTTAQAEAMDKSGILAKHGLARVAGSKDPVHIQLAGTGPSQKSYGSAGGPSEAPAEGSGGEKVVAQDAERVSAPAATGEALGRDVPVSQRPGAIGGGALGTYAVEAFQASGIGPRSGISSSLLTSTMGTGALGGIGPSLPGGIGGLSGLLGQLLPNIMGAGQINQIDQLSQAGAGHDAKMLAMQQQMLDAMTQENSVAPPSSAYYPQKGTDYNNPNDISFGPAWSEIVGLSYPEAGNRVKLSPFKR